MKLDISIIFGGTSGRRQHGPAAPAQCQVGMIIPEWDRIQDWDAGLNYILPIDFHGGRKHVLITV